MSSQMHRPMLRALKPNKPSFVCTLCCQMHRPMLRALKLPVVTKAFPALGQMHRPMLRALKLIQVTGTQRNTLSDASPDVEGIETRTDVLSQVHWNGQMHRPMLRALKPSSYHLLLTVRRSQMHRPMLRALKQTCFARLASLTTVRCIARC